MLFSCLFALLDRRSTCDADSLDASSPASCDFGSFIPVKTPSTCSAGEQHDGATIFTATPPQIHPLSKEAASLQGTIGKYLLTTHSSRSPTLVVLPLLIFL